MFTQRAHWVLSLRGQAGKPVTLQLWLCERRKKTQSLLPHTSKAKDTSKPAAEAQPAALTENKPWGRRWEWG